MSTLSDFAERVTNPEADVPPGVVDPDGRASPRRFAVYRNNLSSTMIEALGASFPACRDIVGEDFFDAVAGIFHRERPPTSPILFRYGEGFADFLETFPPAASVPYLPDVARLEWLRLQSLHAADAEPCAADSLVELPPEILMETRFDVHPALALVRSRWPVVSIVAAIEEGGDLSGIDFERGEDALVTRPDVTVEIRSLPPGALDFLASLQAGGTLGEAATAGSKVDGFDLQASIAGLFEVGAATEIMT